MMGLYDVGMGLVSRAESVGHTEGFEERVWGPVIGPRWLLPWRENREKMLDSSDASDKFMEVVKLWQDVRPNAHI